MVKISKKHHVTKKGVVKKNPKRKRVTDNLPMQTAVLVPSTSKKSHKISAAEFTKRIKRVEKYLTKKFGGFTATQSVGGYTEAKRLIEEDVVMVTAYATEEAFDKHKLHVMDWVRNRGDEWGQDSMGIIIENDLKYISWGKK